MIFGFIFVPAVPLGLVCVPHNAQRAGLSDAPAQQVRFLLRYTDVRDDDPAVAALGLVQVYISSLVVLSNQICQRHALTVRVDGNT